MQTFGSVLEYNLSLDWERKHNEIVSDTVYSLHTVNIISFFERKFAYESINDGAASLLNN